MGVRRHGIMRHIGGGNDVVYDSPVRPDAVVVGFAGIQRHPIGTRHSRDQAVDDGVFFRQHAEKDMRCPCDANPKPVPAVQLRRTGVGVGVGIAIYEAAIAEKIWCHMRVLAPRGADVHILHAQVAVGCSISRHGMKVLALRCQLCLTQRRDPA